MFLHTINEEERRILRTIVKKVHLKHHPEQFCTDYEADKLISISAPVVVERLMKVGKDLNIENI